MAGPEVGGAKLRLMLGSARPIGPVDPQAPGRVALAEVPDLAECPPDPALLSALSPNLLFRHEAVPLRRTECGILFAGARPNALPALAAAAEHEGLGPAAAHRFVPVTPSEIAEALQALAPAQARAALERTPPADSCRTLRARPLALGVAVGVAAALALRPGGAVLVLLALGALLLAATAVLRLLAAFASIRSAGDAPTVTPLRLPVISVLIPLLREDRVTCRLLRRLHALDYPRDRLDIRLVVEEGDRVTARALERAELPFWITVVRVPPGPLRTKPRALNYALDGCRGAIVGIWDAEDAPAPDQLHAIAGTFAAAPPDVGCLQGRLSLEARGRGWIAGCFALEYDVWFGVILPGLARLGLPVPLGGTTLFLRRDAIEAVGGWDAHNVTEDADLGIRLHRRGWRTLLVDTVTVEEPTARPAAWVRQRSRWLKGYAATWAVHARRPAALVRDLGWRGALGFHVLIGGAVVQFALAPLFWLFWPAAFGLAGPLDGIVPTGARHALVALFILSEAVGLAVAVVAARRAGVLRRAWLAPSMLLYFPLATLAAWKAAVELVVAPFYWDKTDHG